MIKWTSLVDEAQIADIREESKKQPVLIFKHSTRCSISNMALNRLERNWNSEAVAPVKTYFLDLLSHRNISNQVADYFGIEHQSPQVLIVLDGKPVYSSSHMAIGFDGISEALSTN